MKALLRGVLDLLLPPACAGCDAPGQAPLCRSCSARLPRIARAFCSLCQQAPSAPGDARCADCAGRASPLEACIAGSWFEADVARWIRRFKYPAGAQIGAGAGRDRARVRALLDASLGWRALEAPTWVVPVPLHRRRLRERGFNPAASLARALARACDVRCAATALERVRDTPSQTGLGRVARRSNVRGAFRARDAVPPDVWLVDDVVTTGATLEACARALRAAGARRVVALCAARTPRSGFDDAR